jgi:uncharacterized protein
MIDAAMPASSMTLPDPASVWRSFLASPSAPKCAMSALELDGYLTGVIVAPVRLRPSQWMAGLWDGDELNFDDAKLIQTVLAALGMMVNTLITEIERSLGRLEAERICDYRPAFVSTHARPAHADVRTWTRGFWRAMALAPTEWHALAADARTQVIISPFIGFIDAGIDDRFEPADDIDNRLDQAASDIPRAVLLLRKIANLRATRSVAAPAARPTKIGRNDPCPCGSGKKFKRCCS